MVRVEIKIFSGKDRFSESIEDDFIIFLNDKNVRKIDCYFYFHDKL